MFDSSADRMLSARLTAPAARADDLPRDALVQAMLANPSARLTLILAAAGFGKTTLLQQFRSAALATGQAVAWLRLDETDNDPERFATHLEASLQAACPSHGSAGASGGDADLLQRLSACPVPFALLLDEFEALRPDSMAASCVPRLLEALPPHGRLVIASRDVPGFSLARLRARGQVLEINDEALSFSLEDLDAFFRKRPHLSLSEADGAALHERTQGWPAAVYLASLSMQGRTTPSEVVAGFSGASFELAQYLAEDILGRQSAACQEFLLDTSVLGRFCIPLCNAVTGRSDAAAMIAELEHRHLFLVRDDDQARWFRYHRLFAEFLRDRLEKTHRGRAPKLHRAAADWYSRSGNPAATVEYLLRAGDDTPALHAIADCVQGLQEDGRSRLLVRWFDQTGPAAIERQPKLALTFAWALALCRRHEEALRTISSVAGSPASKSEDSALEIETIHCLVLAMTDQVRECEARASVHIERIPSGQVFQYGVVAHALIFSLISLSRHDDARRILSRMMQRDVELRSGYRRLLAETFEGIIDLMQGRLGNALVRLRLALSPPDAFGHGVSKTSRVVAYAPLAIALYEANALPEAWRLLTEILPYAKAGGSTDALVASHVLFARIAHLHGNAKAASRALDELAGIGQREHSPRMICSAWLERARQSLRTRNLAEARQALQQAELHGQWAEPELSMYANDIDVPLIGRLRLDIAEGRLESSAEAIRQEISRISALQRRRRELKLRTLLAINLHQQGRRDEAHEALTLALHMASHEGCVRNFLDEGTPLSALLRQWVERHQASAVALGIAPSFAPGLLEKFGAPQEASLDAEPEAPGHSPPHPSAELSSRELQILGLLAAGFRNKVIATRLFISEFTVKSHLRSISSKLGASGRLEIVALARRNGLVD